MSIEAKVIAHSSTSNSPDLITLQLRYPRFIHSEFMTHRVFSRNASSSRAIPIERMIQDVIDDPAMPVAWGSNKPGMQAGDECTNTVAVPAFSLPKQDWTTTHFKREYAWKHACDAAIQHAKGFAEAGYHKQIVNRLLEPFAHISGVVTATEWQNFFDLRCHPDADPTMRALAEAMRDAILTSFAEVLHPGDWHIPYVTHEEMVLLIDERGMNYEDLAMISAARCARVSYLRHDGKQPSVEDDLTLAKRLLASKHMSPFEHQARATGDEGTALCGNFTGWDQHRKMLESQ